MSAAVMNVPATVISDVVQIEVAGGRQSGQHHAGEGVAVERVAEAEIGGGEDLGAVLVHHDRVVGALRRVVDRIDVDAWW